MGKTGISGDFFLGGGRGGRTTKIVGKSVITGDFLGGRNPKIVGKTKGSGDFFFLRRNPKVVGKTGISGDFFCFLGGKEPQDSGKNWDLLRIFFFGEGTPK